MSELVQVEAFKRLIKDTCVGGKIDRVDVLSEDVLRGTSARELQDHLANGRIVDVQRKGTYLLLFTDKGSTIVLTLGDDGGVACQDAPVSELPSQTRVAIRFDDGHVLDFIVPDKRDKLHFFPTANVDKLPLVQELGPDPLEIDYDEFRKRLQTKPHLSIRQALTDQSLISGIGPAYGDEICFHAGVRPYRSVSKLLRSEWQALYDSMQRILTEADAIREDRTQMQRLRYLLPRREANKTGCPRGCGPIKVMRFSPTDFSYFCDACQPVKPLGDNHENVW